MFLIFHISLTLAIHAVFLDFHLGCVVLAGLVVFWVLFAIDFSICANKKKTLGIQCLESSLE
jgi:hypothetical protein